MNHPMSSYEAWAKYVRTQHPSNLVPTEWVAPRRLEEQRRGLKFAMTFGELQRQIASNVAGSTFDVSKFGGPRAPAPTLFDEDDRSLFPAGFEPQPEGQRP